MNQDNFQSPLPPREPVGVSSEPPITENTTTTPPPPPTNEETPPLQTKVSGGLPVSKGVNIKKILPFALAGAGIIIVILLIKSLFTRVTKPEEKKGVDVELTYWGMWEDNSVLESLISEFQSKNPGVKIIYKNNVKENYRTRLDTKLKKNDAGTPDIFRIHSSWVPMFEEYLASVPGDTAKSINLDNDYYLAFQRDLKKKGSYIAVPLMYDQLVLFYNRDLLEKAQKIAPRTWWGFRELAKELTVRGDRGQVEIAGAAMGLVENVDHWPDIIGAMMKQNGIDMADVTNDNLNKILNILKFYTIFTSEDKMWDATLPPSTWYFANGKLAMYLAPSWRIFQIEEIDTNKTLKYEIAGIPQLPKVADAGANSEQIDDANLTNVQWSTYWAEGVNQNSKNQKYAWKFLEFMSQPENLQKMFAASSQVDENRTFGELYPRKSQAATLSQFNPKLSAFVSTADNGQSGYPSDRTFDDGINMETIQYFTDAINKLLQQGQAETDVIELLRSGLSQVVQKYKLTPLQ